MKTASLIAAILCPALLLASCSVAGSGDSAPASTRGPEGHGAFAFRSDELVRLDEPWAAAFAPGTLAMFVTEKKGAVKMVNLATGRVADVPGAPSVDYGGQGGLGDIAFLPAEANGALGTRTIYLSWVEAGQGDTRGAAVGRGKLVCDKGNACRIEGLTVIWRQSPKVTGRGHFSHRLAISPDGKYLYVASGERQKFTPAQDPKVNLGKIVRLNLDGTPAAGNPLADENVALPEIWTMGHRNILGLKFDSAGRLWDLEHGPKGGDELNLVVGGRNYGWPVVSNGDNYDGTPIPRHPTRPEFSAPAISWNPVIAPGDFVFYSGTLWPSLKGQAVIAGLGTEGLVTVRIDGTSATETGRYRLGFRVREIVEGPNGALVVFEDGGEGRVLRLTPPTS